jgi:hypothetical protein
MAKDFNPKVEDFICSGMKRLLAMDDHRCLINAYEKLEESLFWISYYRQEKEDLKVEEAKRKIDELKDKESCPILNLPRSK